MLTCDAVIPHAGGTKTSIFWSWSPTLSGQRQCWWNRDSVTSRCGTRQCEQRYVHETSHDTPRLDVEDLSGQGTIGGLRVRCLTASAQLRAHVGYETTLKDEHDLQLLRDHESDRRFGHT
jgi:hypothetical protein